MVDRALSFNGLGLAILIAWAACMALAGCGYGFVSGGGYPGGATRIYVTIFANRTSETGLENSLARGINQEFTRRDLRALAGHKEQADAVLKGEVKRITIRAVSRRGETLTVEKRVAVTVSSRLVSTSGVKLWQADDLTASETFLVAESKQATNDNKQAAITKLSTRLAEKLYNRLTEEF